METLRDFTNRPGMTFDADKTYILYAEDLAQMKENFDLLNQMLSLSRQYGTSFIGAIKQGDMPVGETGTPTAMEMAGGDVLDDTSAERGGDVAIRPGQNVTTLEKGNSHVGSVDGSAGYSVAGEMSQHRFLPVSFNNIDDVMFDAGGDYLEMKSLKSFSTMADTMRQASSSPFVFTSGNYYDNTLTATAITQMTSVGNRFEAYPFYCGQDVEISEFGVVAASFVAGSNVKVAIYSNGADGLPADLLFGSTDISTASTGYKAQDPGLSLEAGKMYWFAVRQSSTFSLRAIPVASAKALFASNSTATSYITGLRKTLTFADAWPSTTPFTTTDYIANITPVLFRFLVA